MKEHYKWISAIIFLILLVVADRISARIANNLIIKNDIDVLSDLNEINPDFKFKPERRLLYCRHEKKLIFYLYQICFVAYNSHLDREKWGYHYVYFSPKPITTLFPSAKNIDDYYFRASALGKKLYFVDINRNIRSANYGLR